MLFIEDYDSNKEIKKYIDERLADRTGQPMLQPLAILPDSPEGRIATVHAEIKTCMPEKPSIFKANKANFRLSHPYGE